MTRGNRVDKESCHDKVMPSQESNGMDTGKDLNDWLAYSISPRELTTELRPAMWGNGRLELMAELDRPCVSEVVCFGFGDVGLNYTPEQHLVPALHDHDTGRKYLLDVPRSSGAQDFSVTFRPDRQTWRYQFDDLTVSLSLILPIMYPGYLLKVRLRPHKRNNTKRWRIYQQLRGYMGNILLGTVAGSDLSGGTAWCMSKTGKGEAIGSTVDAQTINLGLDYGYANDIMIKTVVEDNGYAPDDVYFARAFGSTVDEARENLKKLLSSPRSLEAEAEAWWNRYLNEVPRLDVPDETFAKAVLWSWPNVRVNRIEVPIAKMPAGLIRDNFCSIKLCQAVVMSNLEIETIQLLHDPKPTRDTILYWLRETRKSGLLGSGVISTSSTGLREDPGNYVQCLGWFCGLLQRYLLTTNDLGLLDEPIGDGLTVLKRLEDSLEAQMDFRDEETGLFWIDGEMKRFPKLFPGEAGGLGPQMEAITRIRGSTGSFYSETSAMVYGTFLALADIEELTGNTETCANYRRRAKELGEAIQKHLWDDELGMFIDLLPDKSVSDYLGIGGLVTGLFANHTHRPGGLATPEQAERLAAWCSHPDFASDFGTLCMARSSPYYDASDWKGYNSNLDMHWSTQIPAGLYAHECYEEAHRQLFKLFRRLGENGGLGPHYRGECYHADTGEILPKRFVNYACIFSALSSIFEGVFGLRWTKDALTVHVNAPWPWAKLSNLRIRGSILNLELMPDASLVARINGETVAESDNRKIQLPWELFS